MFVSSVLFIVRDARTAATPIFPNHYHPGAIPFRSCLRMLTRILSQTLCYQMGTYTFHKETGASIFIRGLPSCLPLAFATAIASVCLFRSCSATHASQLQIDLPLNFSLPILSRNVIMR